MSRLELPGLRCSSYSPSLVVVFQLDDGDIDLEDADDRPFFF
jgi:hypothetical protein